jgi:thymidine kinase
VNVAMAQVRLNFLVAAMFKLLMKSARSALRLAIFIQKLAMNVKAKERLKSKAITSMKSTIAGGTKKMNNLFDRLKPEYKALLVDQAEFYPNAIPAIIEELKKESSILDLRYGTVGSLALYLNLKNSGITEIFNLFNEK